MHITKWKNPIRKGFIRCDSNYVTWKSVETVHRTVVARSYFGEGWIRGEQASKGSEYIRRHQGDDPCRHTLVQTMGCTTPSMNPNVSEVLWLWWVSINSTVVKAKAENPLWKRSHSGRGCLIMREVLMVVVGVLGNPSLPPSVFLSFFLFFLSFCHFLDCSHGIWRYPG